MISAVGKNAHGENSHDLCERYGMRMRMVVMERDVDYDLNRMSENTNAVSVLIFVIIS